MTEPTHTLTLKHGDPRLGILDGDGGIAVWPSVALDGRPYSPLRVTFIHATPKGYFVVCRAGADTGNLSVQVDETEPEPDTEGGQEPAPVTDPDFVQKLVAGEVESARKRRGMG